MDGILPDVAVWAQNNPIPAAQKQHFLGDIS
jgi:hypothetical protein